MRRQRPVDALPAPVREAIEGLQLRPVGFVLRMGWLFYKALQEDKAFLRAAGMAYASLMALVPLLVLVFGILGSLGVLHDPKEQEAVYDAVFGTLFGDVRELREAITPFLSNIDFRALGVASTAVLLFVAARLFLMVERAYSDIFRARMDRNLSRRILNFYFAITAVPVVMVLSVQGAVSFGSSAFQGAIVSFLQFVLLVVALKYFPCTRVRWGPALIGAATSWALLGLCSQGFQAYVAWSYADPNYALRAFYGSLILIPIFLLWLYTFWIVILLGVEVAHVAQDYDTLLDAERQARERDRGLRAPSLANALEVLARVAARYERGAGPTTLVDLREETHLAGWDLGGIADTLVEAGLLVAAGDGFVPARPSSSIDLDDVASRWRDLTRIGGDEGIAREVGDASGLGGTLEDAVERWLPEAERAVAK
ncbi:MAG: YihY/virulence factor BrkB family protein [Myxococcales bacterium]|nr:YihY/virulence factor BrkB family protein [Myxococcales bacterium]MCB9669923.1 YihY/virulence factor BrkB family protein [Alphaproteobacteria bacterium]MCB9693203.1 YihY/virulence factor BrkB family protein [Alphaproteobacteria bacterium]